MKHSDNTVKALVSEVENRIVNCIYDDLKLGYTKKQIRNKIKSGAYIGNSLETFYSYKNSEAYNLMDEYEKTIRKNNSTSLKIPIEDFNIIANSFFYNSKGGGRISILKLKVGNCIVTSENNTNDTQKSG